MITQTPSDEFLLFSNIAPELSNAPGVGLAYVFHASENCKEECTTLI